MINYPDKISPNINLIYGILFFFCLCNSISSQNKLTDKADVFIGTGGLGHTFPHAMIPLALFQMVPIWKQKEEYRTINL